MVTELAKGATYQGVPFFASARMNPCKAMQKVVRRDVENEAWEGFEDRAKMIRHRLAMVGKN